MEDSCNKPVMVTGGTGFLASHLISALLARNIAVRTTVRSLHDKNKYSHLFSLNPNAVQLLEVVEANLLDEASWIAPVQGCRVVFHLASPFPSTVPKDESEIIKPAVKGTLNVLNACLKNGVKRVILTSSIAAVMVGNENLVCTEDNWSSETVCPPYEKSKLLAEEAAWKLYNQYKDKMDLTVLCPGLIWGPHISQNTFTSGEVVQMIMLGQLPAIPNLSFPVVDVRDTVLAHINAMERAETIGRRYLLVADCLTAEEIVSILREEYMKFGYRFPRIKVGKLLVKLAALYNPMFKLFVPSIGIRYEISNRRSIEELGLSYKAPKSSIIDMVNSMINRKIIPDRRHSNAKL